MRTPPADLPRRDPCESSLTHGGKLLCITVWRIVGRNKDGEEKLRKLATTYLLERRLGHVDLVKEDGEVYTVTPRGCTCKDAQVRGAERSCKHWTACEQQCLFAAEVA